MPSPAATTSRVALMQTRVIVLAGPDLANLQPTFGFTREDYVYPSEAEGEPYGEGAAFVAVEKLLDDLDAAKKSLEAQARALQRVAGQGPQEGS